MSRKSWVEKHCFSGFCQIGIKSYHTWSHSTVITLQKHWCARWPLVFVMAATFLCWQMMYGESWYIWAELEFVGGTGGLNLWNNPPILAKPWRAIFFPPITFKHIKIPKWPPKSFLKMTEVCHFFVAIFRFVIGEKLFVTYKHILLEQSYNKTDFKLDFQFKFSARLFKQKDTAVKRNTNSKI